MKLTPANRIHCNRAWSTATHFCGICGARLLRPARWTHRRIALALAAATVVIAAMVGVGIATTAGTGSPGAACNDENAIRRVRAGVVRVSTSESVGTGVVVQDGLVLTAAHVIGRANVFVGPDDDLTVGAVIFVDETLDLALISADTGGMRAVEFSDERDLTAGDQLLALGYALDLPGAATTTSGVFSALRQDGDVTFVQTDTPLNRGNSGGPLFTVCGKVVGINVGVAEQAQNINFALGASEVERALRERE